MKFSKALLAGALMSAVAGTASATTYTFNSNGTVFNIDGITLTVTSTAGSVNNSSSGLGVKRSTFESGDMNSDLINEGKDTLVFTFSKAVKLNSFSMSSWQNGSSLDQADLKYKGVTTRLPNTGPNFTFTPTDYVTSFSLTAKGGGTAFRVKSLGVTEQPAAPTTPAVPVPAAAWLMGSGLVGLAGLARRKRK
jgi:hypothetical protein